MIEFDVRYILIGIFNCEKCKFLKWFGFEFIGFLVVFKVDIWVIFKWGYIVE